MQPSASSPASSAQLGMVRIQQGNAPGGALAGSQERYVWPVHLPGWLAMGWRVAGHQVASHEVTAPSAALQADAAGSTHPEAVATKGTVAEDPVPAGKGRRGRHRKEAPVEPAAAAVEAAATTQAEEIEETETPTLDPNAAPALDDNPEMVLPDERTSAEGREADGLSSDALPDDLFDAPI